MYTINAYERLVIEHVAAAQLPTIQSGQTESLLRDRQ
jgi:hypothetical protein